MEGHESRRASGVIVGLALAVLMGLIVALGTNAAFAAPSDGGGLTIGIVR